MYHLSDTSVSLALSTSKVGKLPPPFYYGDSIQTVTVEWEWGTFLGHVRIPMVPVK